MLSRRLLFVMIFCCGPCFAVAGWELGASEIGFDATMEGETFTGRFVGAQVVPALSQQLQPLGFQVRILLDRVDTGDAGRDAELRETDWFDVPRFPVARFRSDQVLALGGANWIARGELELKGVSREVSVPFNWRLVGGNPQMRGQLTIDRRWFGVGPPETDSIAADVTVFYRLSWGAADASPEKD